MADNQDLKEEIIKERILFKDKERKNLLQKILWTKRKSTAYKDVQRKLDFFVQEEKEDSVIKPEEQVGNGLMDLSKHRKRHKKGKRCWICKSFYHKKRKCPKNKCFYCGKLGHIKADCHLRKINFIFSRLWKDMKEKDERRNKRTEEIYAKRKQKELEIKVFTKRAHELRVVLEKREKGDTPVLQWKGTTVGECTNAPYISQTIDNFQHDRFDWSKINLLVERASPYMNFTFYKGLTNWCGCGQIDMETNDFIAHLKEHHKGVVIKNSQLNRPPWLDRVKYKNDTIEELICYTEEEDLHQYLLD